MSAQYVLLTSIYLNNDSAIGKKLIIITKINKSEKSQKTQKNVIHLHTKKVLYNILYQKPIIQFLNQYL